MMLPEKQGKFCAEDIDDSKDVGVGCVGDNVEKNTIYVHNTILVKTLAMVKNTNQGRNENSLKQAYFDQLWFPYNRQEASPDQCSELCYPAY